MENYEEKYKQALEVIKDLYNKTRLLSSGEAREITLTLEKNFPELAESEDEKMMKALKHYLSVRMCQTNDDEEYINCNRFLNWLEKQKPKQSPKWLYRLEYKDGSCGLWYDGSGKWCFENGIGSLGDSCKTKTLPMDYDDRYKEDGRDWFSSCSNKEDLLHWYSKEDARELISKGFVFTRYLATEYHEYDKQTVFIKDTALYREEIDFFEAMNKQERLVWSEEDEIMINDFINSLKYNHGNGYDKQISWLKSLKPQHHWKPTVEQMKHLQYAIRICKGVNEHTDAQYLEELFTELQKLK